MRDWSELLVFTLVGLGADLQPVVLEGGAEPGFVFAAAELDLDLLR